MKALCCFLSCSAHTCTHAHTERSQRIHTPKNIFESDLKSFVTVRLAWDLGGGGVMVLLQHLHVLCQEPGARIQAGSRERGLRMSFQHHPASEFKACFKTGRVTLNSSANSKVMPKTLIRRIRSTLRSSRRRKCSCEQSNDSKPIIITVSRVKSVVFGSAEREHNCTVHTAGNRLQMKANLVSLCN